MNATYTKLETPLYAYATKAFHLLGEISRFETPNPNPPKNEQEVMDQFFSSVEYNETDLNEHVCSIYGEDEENWYGSWITGAGYFDVRFPKSTTRALTEEEMAKLYSQEYRISDQPPFKLGEINTIDSEIRSI